MTKTEQIKKQTALQVSKKIIISVGQESIAHDRNMVGTPSVTVGQESVAHDRNKDTAARKSGEVTT